MAYDILEHTRTIQELLQAERPFVVVTLVGIRGSAPQIVGAKAIITLDGIECGTVGGGKVEAACVEHGRRLLEQNTRGGSLEKWNLQTDIGMTCGGEVQLFFEVHTRSAWPIAVYGAGHVAQALIRQLLTLNCTVTCIDTRSDWIAKLPDDPKLRRLVVEEPRSTVRSQPKNAFFVLMSKGHATDLPVLAEILSTRQAPYVGVIGSPQKASVLRRDLEELNLPNEAITSFHCPLGLPIGDNTPAEIAISIVAQLIQERDRLATEL